MEVNNGNVINVVEGNESNNSITDSDFRDAENQGSIGRENTVLSVLTFIAFFSMIVPVMYAINPLSLYIIPVFTTLTFVSMHAPQYLSLAFFDVRIYCVAIVLITTFL